MTSPDRCSAVQARLSEALLAREAAAAVDQQHAERCDVCGASERGLRELARTLEADPVPTASDALLHVTLERASGELRRLDAAHEAPPDGWRREVGRLVGVALLPLPLVLLWNAAVLSFGGEILGGIVPAALLRAIGTGYVVAGATWLACLYGSLPVVAHRQLRRRALEVVT